MCLFKILSEVEIDIISEEKKAIRRILFLLNLRKLKRKKKTIL